jgi:hypothetical protein
MCSGILPDMILAQMSGIVAVVKQVVSLASCVAAHGKTPLLCLPTWQAMCVMHSVTMVIQTH